FQLTEAASVGIEMAAAVGVGAFFGRLLERNVTHWAPWTTMIGLGIGIAAAVFAVIRTARNFTRVIAAEEAAEAEEAARALAE
ncbi:AtpZ/AtpI family protein, partial [Bacillus velezensis]|uniref:AtpZ/AtpI family protein n=1 Tax=Bacillus velezensis TaxID=492670 RepID=UPI003C1E1ADD